MQVQHKAAVHTATAHPAPVEHHGPMDVAALGMATVLIFGVPLFCLFVLWRFWRWFFRATR